MKGVLHPTLKANIWKPGQTGNPKGFSGLYGEAVRLAQAAAPDAVRRLIELMNSEDDRVAVVACNAILDRALGKPKVLEEKDDLVAKIKAMTPEERESKGRESYSNKGNNICQRIRNGRNRPAQVSLSQMNLSSSSCLQLDLIHRSLLSILHGLDV